MNVALTFFYFVYFSEYSQNPFKCHLSEITRFLNNFQFSSYLDVFVVRRFYVFVLSLRFPVSKVRDFRGDFFTENLLVCDSFRATHVIWMVMLLSAIGTMLFLGIAVWMGWIYRKRLALQNIKYTSGAVH